MHVDYITHVYLDGVLISFLSTSVSVAALLSNAARMSTSASPIAKFQLAEKKNVTFTSPSQLNLLPSLLVSSPPRQTRSWKNTKSNPYSHITEKWADPHNCSVSAVSLGRRRFTQWSLDSRKSTQFSVVGSGAGCIGFPITISGHIARHICCHARTLGPRGMRHRLRASGHFRRNNSKDFTRFAVVGVGHHTWRPIVLHLHRYWHR